MSFLRSPLFWLPLLLTLLIAGSLFAWELGFVTVVPGPIRPAPSGLDLLYAGLLTLLLSFNVGLAAWHTRHGSCPVGSKRAIGTGGVIGAVALLCPVCLILPFSLFGLGAVLALLTPFVPLLQIIALIVLSAALYLLWPTRQTQ
jgi:hypothetical protein